MKHRCLLAILIGILFCNAAQADDGEFWEHAVSETILSTKPMTDSWVKLTAGMSAPLDVQENQLLNVHVPAPLRFDAGARFLGIPVRPDIRLLRIRGNLGLGIYDDSHTELDSGSARLNIVTFQKGGLLSLASVGVTTEKAVNEKLGVRVDAADLNVGGATKAFVFGLSTKALGYERRENYSGHVYHGFYLVSIGMDMGFVILRSARVISLEIKIGGDVEVSLPTQKDASADTSFVVHFNNDWVPIDLTAFGGFNYTDDPDAGDELHYWSVGGRLGVRF